MNREPLNSPLFLPLSLWVVTNLGTKRLIFWFCLIQCSGPDAPCKACRSTNTECHFDPSRDLRRKVAVKRTIQELTNHKYLLESLLSTLGSADQPQFDKVMDLIRKKASFQDIAHAVGSPVTTFGDTQDLSTASRLPILEYGGHAVETSGNAVRRPSDPGNITSSPEEPPSMKPPQWATVSPYARITLESLCDIPLFEVSAKPWTSVTDDDFLVSQLVSLYFTWDHPCSQFLDQRIFLESMKFGNRGSVFCTPLLVNSLLSIASVWIPEIYHATKQFANLDRPILIALMFFPPPRTCSRGVRNFSRRHKDCGRLKTMTTTCLISRRSS